MEARLIRNEKVSGSNPDCSNDFLFFPVPFCFYFYFFFFFLFGKGRGTTVFLSPSDLFYLDLHGLFSSILFPSLLVATYIVFKISTINFLLLPPNSLHLCIRAYHHLSSWYIIRRTNGIM